MDALERGAIANPDEQRMVGHYWLRAPRLAPNREIETAIRGMQERALDFARRVHAAEVTPPTARSFRHLLVVGIGGSALGPQLLADALGGRSDRLSPHFLDNTDPDGFDRVLGGIGEALAETLVVVISKSGGTAETRNGMLETAAALRARGLAFGPQAVAITQEGSALDREAREQGFLERFPMWDWVGGRTSVTSAVGLVPAALQGIDVRALLAGAAAMDETHATRRYRAANPAALLALAWHAAGEGRGSKAMVVLPYKDRLLLFSRYLQQLVMESLGKEKDLAGRVVHQGLSVYGNKGSTDQHAFVQQLRDGLANFFVTFIRVLKDRSAEGLEVEPGVTSGDYLDGFLLGTRRALFENGRPSLTLTLPDVSARSLGDADRPLRARGRPLRQPRRHQRLPPAGRRGRQEGRRGDPRSAAPGGGCACRSRRRGATCDELAAAAGAPEEVETVLLLLERLAANPGRGVKRRAGSPPSRPSTAPRAASRRQARLVGGLAELQAQHDVSRRQPAGRRPGLGPVARPGPSVEPLPETERGDRHDRAPMPSEHERFGPSTASPEPRRKMPRMISA